MVVEKDHSKNFTLFTSGAAKRSKKSSVPWHPHIPRRFLASANANKHTTTFSNTNQSVSRIYHYVQKSNVVKHYVIKIRISILPIIPHIMENKWHSRNGRTT